MTSIIHNTDGLTDDQVERAANFVQGLHDLADWLSRHPEWACRLNACYTSRYVWGDDEAANEDGTNEKAVQELAGLARELAPCEKVATDYSFGIKRWFGPHQVSVVVNREDVCVKRVTGTKLVQRYTYSEDDQAKIDAMQRSTRTVEEEEVEWECKPLLNR